MNENRLKKLHKWAETNATSCIFPFWTSEYIMDQENGGFYSVVTLDMQRSNSEPRGLTLTGRMLYAFSSAYRVFGDEIYRQRAEYTFRELISRFYDREYGGAFTTVTEKGEVLTTDKPNYCEAFLIMGCAAYYHATGDQEALRIAMESFRIMETKAKFAPACYYGNMTRNFQPTEGFGFGRKGMESPFPPDAIMFPHHLCQAYLRLYQAMGDPEVGSALRDMVSFIANSLYDSQYHCFKTIISKDGSRIGTNQSFGHDCEISYLAVNAARLVGGKALQETIKAVVTDVLYHVLGHNFSPYGSLYNGGDLVTGEKNPKSHVWWAQAESVSAMLCGYALTGDEQFLSACETQTDFIEKYFVNREHGDWYNNILVDETGGHIVDGMHGFDKLNPGKCPFHNSQMCFEVMERTAALLRQEETA